MNRKAFSTIALAVLLAAVFSVATFADDFLFLAPVVGSNPGITIAGVPSGGAPWTVRRGSAILTNEGRLRVDVRGLILPSVGNAGPITQVAASVVCSNAVAATTKAVNLSNTGNADINARLAIPSPCIGAIVLVRVAGVNNAPLPAPTAFIAATGLAKNTQDNDDDDNDANDDRGNDGPNHH
jgi:hypothetical protein